MEMDRMPEDQELIGEIRRRLRVLPKGAIIDSLAWATALGSSGYSNTVPEIGALVRAEGAAAGVSLVDRNSYAAYVDFYQRRDRQ
jgi:hypothetical protein